MPQLTEVEKSYIAGFVDGEGCVSLATRKAIKYITPLVQIANTNLEILKYIQSLFGGTINDRKEVRPNRKPSWSIQLSGQKAMDLVKAIYPYVRIKKAQCDILLSLKRYNPSAKRDKLGRLMGVFTPEIEKENAELVSKIRFLNKRGLIINTEIYA